MSAGSTDAFADLSELETAARSLGVHLTARDSDRFRQFGAMLVRENAHVNLTAITDPAQVQTRHFADSLSVVPAVDAYIRLIGGDVAMLSTVRVLDVGSGAGFPGLPLAIMRPRVAVTLLEATGKKVAFIRRVADDLGLDNVTALNFRAEEAAHHPTLRAQMDIVLARAVARLPVLLEYCLPFVRPNGFVLALKSGDLTDELRESAAAASALGGTIGPVTPIPVAGLEGHVLIRIDKSGDTPAHYPRRPGIPTKRPLGG
ncbi:MAG: 16S rRNA (guanine(527)-N(7))-methyltransferase RsmG [Thermomicrobia bacterium]|nr:16S rRNA (guanine(527)-N(7))-methyltransferase RsmG [Thermomicrobia bacterium]